MQAEHLPGIAHVRQNVGVAMAARTFRKYLNRQGLTPRRPLKVAYERDTSSTGPMGSPHRLRTAGASSCPECIADKEGLQIPLQSIMPVVGTHPFESHS